MKILITGTQGFIGSNLCLRLEEAGFTDLIKIDRNTSEQDLISGLQKAEFIFHLAGSNRPKNETEFTEVNSKLTKKIVNYLAKKNIKTPIMLSSSTQAEWDNAYGISKAEAEKWVEEYGETNNIDYYIYRFPNVFGKWCRPNYNSFVATFCYNIANNLDITINDPLTTVTLIYIDDLCSELINLLQKKYHRGYLKITPEYNTTIGEVSDLIYRFKNSRNTLITENVGTGFTRALYSTWLSYLRPEQFSYQIPIYGDTRGFFCEMLKTPSTGQFSFFTAYPGITRGGHYHHTKNEKFLVIKGQAKFKFKHVITGEKYELNVSHENYEIVETVPGWSHDITNIGDDEMIVILWANEIFDRKSPDTIAKSL
ncbi:MULTISPECIES: UDP-2-acetamido-2,6-beta-L-arabino-hexul-4-ose reductase [Xenorhabdus]|uniref:UDP-2-acetamido-2,6-beta-L-arabino-hexul-4-ose reductase n=1 Tax=Xenorhabdus TaxID=626 RepID=UPI00064A6EAE|nr:MULTISPECIES: NAD-dependent epimerase/dehydratase family protein [Xenorhabdus]KLU15996.1 capsular biosynthesis protein [Xenorhabdus griffiniae]KOP33895.1 capsular biosynthesis protein [Xenorhabdus sp. GDc328]